MVSCALTNSGKEADTEYAELGPDLYGVNNRNLGTFETDVNNSLQLLARLPYDVLRSAFAQ